MITLEMPKVGQNRFWFMDGTAFGLFDSNNSSETEKIPFRSELEAMEEEKGMYGENNVTHTSLKGDFYYSPLFEGLIPLMDDANPYMVGVPNKSAAGVPGYRRCHFGVASHGGSSIRNTGFQWQHRAWFKLDDYTWGIYEIVTNNFAPGTVAIANFTSFGVQATHSNNLATMYYTSRTWTGGYKSGIVPTFQGNQLMSALAIQAVFSELVLSAPSSGQGTCEWWYHSSSSIASPLTARQKINSIVRSAFGDEFPIPDAHYGDLAMKAAEEIDANKVNMIAFLRDLRKPWELIPKLKELKTLKGASGQYLGLEYGILPTISDVKEIKAAFNKIKPYVDKNGFSVYTAGRTTDLQQATANYSLTQRIKLAISDEDDEFQALIQRLENIGIWPDLVNIWDLIPYSFVLDWLVDVGSFLERVDFGLRLLRLNIRYVTMSRKSTVSGYFPASQDKPIHGTVEWVHYHRWVSDQCPLPPLSLQTSFSDFNHWLESSALIIQRKK